MAKSKDIQALEEIVNELLSLMGTDASADISMDEENEAYLISLESEHETGLLIGSHGDTLQAIQLIVSMMYRQREGEWKRILVNVADWRERQEEKLVQLAETTAERVVSTGESVPLYNLKPSERRIVHMTLAERTDIVTESVDEGEERHLVVRPA